MSKHFAPKPEKRNGIFATLAQYQMEPMEYAYHKTLTTDDIGRWFVNVQGCVHFTTDPMKTYSARLDIDNETNPGNFDEAITHKAAAALEREEMRVQILGPSKLHVEIDTNRGRDYATEQIYQNARPYIARGPVLVTVAPWRSTVDEWRIESLYSAQYGYEESCAESSLYMARLRLREYQANQPQFAHRIRKTRVKKYDL